MPSRLPKRRKPTPHEAGEPADPAKRDEAEFRAADLTGLKFFKKVRPLLDSLHDIGTARDKPRNRDRHMDQYGVLVLMWLFNPILTSLRGLQQASTLSDVQKKFRVGRASLVIRKGEGGNKLNLPPSPFSDLNGQRPLWS